MKCRKGEGRGKEGGKQARRGEEKGKGGKLEVR